MVEFETCCVVGLGYIGLPTAALIASRGIQVIGVDINEATIDKVSSGQCPISEPGLAPMIESVTFSGMLRASLQCEPADVFIIAVPTPFRGGFKPDLTYVEAAVRSVAPHLTPGNIVVIESTIPVGTTEQVAQWLRELRPDLAFPDSNDSSNKTSDISIAHSPERILPGQMQAELVSNDRVIGGLNKQSAERCRDFYRLFVEGRCITTDARSAELCKLTENAYRDVNIAFANELANICKNLDVDVWTLIELANHHPRVKILQPGPGVGGHCIAIDPWFIVSAVGEKARLIREARWINSERPRHVVEEVLDAARQTAARSISCFGLSYKADVEDLRESPAIEIVQYLSTEASLISRDITITVVEPHIDRLPEDLATRSNVMLGSISEGLGADVVVLLVDHKSFKEIPHGYLKGRKIIDTRGCWR